jgi:hypothetical protein
MTRACAWCRSAGRATGPVKPDAVIASLGELPAALDRLAGARDRGDAARAPERPGLRQLAIAAAVVAAVFALFVQAPDFLTTMETKPTICTFACGARDPGDQVVIVAADEKSLATFGRWLRPRRSSPIW